MIRMGNANKHEGHIHLCNNSHPGMNLRPSCGLLVNWSHRYSFLNNTLQGIVRLVLSHSETQDRLVAANFAPSFSKNRQTGKLTMGLWRGRPMEMLVTVYNAKFNP